MSPRARLRLSDLSEEGILERILPRFAARQGDLVGPGDDAAVLRLTSDTLVATTDAFVRNRDWVDAWSTPADVAVKCLTQNLADIGAMGAVPTSLLVTLVADPATEVDWVERFAEALGVGCARAQVSVLGGDLSSAPEGVLVISVTALGQLAGRPPVRRGGARPGDVVAVAGTLGTAGAGLLLLQRQGPSDDPLVAAHLRPTGAWWEGPPAADAGATAMIDISDGLLRDVDRVGRASGVRVDLSRAALGPDVERLVPAVGAADALTCVLTGGEEHSLVATFPSVSPLPDGWRVIGAVHEGAGIGVDGADAVPAGWDHFAG